MKESILVTESCGSESEVLDDRTGGLSMNEISIRQRILETGNDAVNVVLPHLADVLEQERHRLETTVSNVEFRRSIFVENRRDASERSTRLGDDSCSTSHQSCVNDGKTRGTDRWRRYYKLEIDALALEDSSTRR